MTAVVLCVVETCSSWCLAFAAVMWEPYGFFRVSKWQCYMIDVNYLYGIRRGLVAMSKVRFLAPAKDWKWCAYCEIFNRHFLI